MIDLAKTQQEIEVARDALNRLVISKRGNTTDPDVATLSTHLDKLIVRYEQLKATLELQRGS